MALNSTETPRLNVLAMERGSKKPDTARIFFSRVALQELLKEESIVSQPPHDVVYSRLPFNKTDRYWWHTIAVVLSKLMLQADYPLPLRYKTLAYQTVSLVVAPRRPPFSKTVPPSSAA